MLIKPHKETLQDFYDELVLLWRELCVLHTQLFEITSHEYQLLLGGETEKLETNLSEKKEIIAKIQDYDSRRQTSISDLIEKFLPSLSDPHFQEINEFLQRELALGADHALLRYNYFLIDIIEKIQIQNRKNRQFLNRALLMMEDLKHDFQKKGKVLSYNKKGSLQKHTR